MTLRVLIVDDEPLARESIRLMLGTRGGVEVVAEAFDVASARECLAQLEVDLVFLDIRMPGASGLELAAELSGLQAPLVVVVTAHAEFAISAFGVHAADFLLKPFDESRLAEAIDVVARRRAERSSYHALAAAQGLAEDLRTRPGAPPPHGNHLLDGERIIIRDRRRVIYVPLDEIVHCRSSRNYIRVHTSTRWHLLRLPLASLVAVLEPAQFIQVHRTALINIRHVTELTATIHGDYIVRLSTGTKVRLSRRRRGAIARLVNGPDSRGPQ